MLKKLLSATSVCIALSATLPSVAHATQPALPSCEFTGWKTTFNWGLGITAIDCFGAISGNNQGAQAGPNPGVTGTLALLESEFDLNGPGNAASNGWAVLQSFPETATGSLTFSQFISGDFAVALKQSNRFSVYRLRAASPINQISYVSNGVQEKNTPNLEISHGDLYSVRGGPTPSCIGINGCTNVVPEPSTYALMTAGLLGIFGVARRRRNSAKV
jgi:hypothetical protein